MMRFSIQIFLLILFSFQYLYSQPTKEHFILEGKISGIENGVIYLSFYDAIAQIGKTDSTFIKNGLFSFSGKLNQPAVAFITLIKREAFGLNATNIFLEPANMFIDLQFNAFDKAHLTGSGTQTEYELLTEKWNTIKINHPELFDSNLLVHNNLDDALKEKVTEVFDTLNRIDYAYFSQHPDSYLTAYLLQYHARNLSPDSLAMFFNRLSDDLKQHVVTQNIRSRLKNMKVGTVGTIAPKFFAKDTSGNDFYSGLIKDKYILLDFWASWCLPCRQNSPHLIELFKKYENKGLKIIGIADDRDILKWKAAITEDKTGVWTQVLRGANPELKSKGLKDENDINDKFGLHQLPTYILIDPTGVIIGRYQDDLSGLNMLLQTLMDKK